MGDEPVDRMRGHQPQQCGNRQPEAGIGAVPKDRDQHEHDRAKRLGSTDDREARIVNGLGRQIILFRQSHLAGEFERMRKHRRKCQCDKDQCQNLQRDQHRFFLQNLTAGKGDEFRWEEPPVHSRTSAASR
jgi:hypothetical protein